MSAVLRVEDLVVHLPVRAGLFGKAGTVHAVDGVNLEVSAGETLALVGESGCGKSTLARTVMGLARPTGGAVAVCGRSIASADRAEQRAYRRSVQMVFQDPTDTLNPRRTVFDTLRQPLQVHKIVPRNAMREEATRLVELVGLTPGSAFLDRRPSQLSGGQRQRVAIARALAVRPKVMVADEAVSALDVSVRAQILQVLLDLRSELDLAMLFISHDLSVVRAIADRVAIMYLGEIVETGPTESVFARPRHPYSRALLDASPASDPRGAREHARRRQVLRGEIPSPLAPPSGCRFRTRCPRAQDVCATPPPLVVDGLQRALCHFPLEVGEREIAFPTVRGAGV